MTELCWAAIDRGAEVWSYTGQIASDRFPDEVRYVNHRRLGHIRLLLRKRAPGRIIDSSHFHLEYPNPLLLPFWILCKRLLRFQWIKAAHDGSLPARARDFGILRRLLFAAAIRNIDEIIVCSPELEAWLVDAAGFRGRVRHVPVVLPLAPDWDSETPSGRLKESLDRYASHEYRVFSIGSFDTAYGFHHVVEAVEQIRNDKGLDIGVFLADGGLVKDDAYKHALIEGRDWVEIGDRVPRGCLAKVFEQSSVFVRACAYESYGLSRIEALWSGVPVIATNAGETRGMTIYDYGDVTALSKYLLSVLDGETEIDLNQWAEVYAEEARRNVEAWLDLITGPESS